MYTKEGARELRRERNEAVRDREPLEDACLFSVRPGDIYQCAERRRAARLEVARRGASSETEREKRETAETRILRLPGARDFATAV